MDKRCSQRRYACSRRSLAFVLEDWEHGLWMFAAAVAVATSDTWASEVVALTTAFE